MSLADRTRRAAREHPFLVEALGAGVVNYAAAARYLSVDGDDEAVATALNRFAEELDPPGAAGERAGTVRMQRGLERTDVGEPGVLAVGETGYVPGDGRFTGLVATGDLGPGALGDALARLRVEDVPLEAAGAAGNAIAVVVDGDPATALRVLEDVVQGTTRS